MHHSWLATLLLLLWASAPARGESAPAADRIIGDRLVRFNVTSDTSRNLACPPGNGFLGVSHDGQYVSRTLNFGVDLRFSGMAELDRVRKEKLGAYQCLYQDIPFTNAYTLILSELPRQVPKNRVSQLGPGEHNELTWQCIVDGSGSVRWERYNDKNGLFDLVGTSGSLTIKYEEAAKNQHGGFSVYRCYKEDNPKKISFYQAQASPTLKTRPFRTSQYSSTLLGYVVSPATAINLECSGKRLVSSVRPTFEFQARGKETFSALNTSVRGVSVVHESAQSQVMLAPLFPEHTGVYRCDKDGVEQRARIIVDYGGVFIREYSKTEYKMQTTNVITCQATQSVFKNSTFFMLYRSDNSSLKLLPGTEVDGYKTSYNSAGHLMVEFDDRDDAINARLECQLYFTSDYVKIVENLPELTLTSRSSLPPIYVMDCTENLAFGGTNNLEVYRLNFNGTKANKLMSFNKKLEKQGFYLRGAVGDAFGRFICQSMYKGRLLESNILNIGKPNVSLDIFVEKERNPSKKVYVAGNPIDIKCSFQGLPYKMEPSESDSVLQKNGSAVPIERTRVNASTFDFSIRRASTADSGRYRCAYKSVALLRAGGGVLRADISSPESEISICSGSQFVCDMTCKDRSLMCDKKEDCDDGADEREEYCNKCEPNEVKCKPYKGEAPKKICVLKHWLCDGTNDCGNNYDEDAELNKKWCFKEPDCRNCSSGETCCSISSGKSEKCILRSYECDKENDCPDGSDEKMCREGECLEIMEPTSRIVVEKKVGEAVSMTCLAKGTERPTINWRRNWAALPKDGVEESNRVTGRGFTGDYTVEGTLAVANVTKEMAGIYNCEAVNNCKRLLSYEIELKVVD